jgi:hypothetical protein
MKNLKSETRWEIGGYFGSEVPNHKPPFENAWPANLHELIDQDCASIERLHYGYKRFDLSAGIDALIPMRRACPRKIIPR